MIERFIADFHSHVVALVVEVEGKIHKKQTEYNAKGDRILVTRRFRLLKSKKEEVWKRIAIACTERT